MTILSVNNVSGLIFNIKFWTHAKLTTVTDNFIYELSNSPKINLHVTAGDEDASKLRDFIKSNIPKRGSEKLKQKTYSAIYQSCFLDDPNQAAESFTEDSYFIEANKVIVPKSTFDQRNVVRPLFFLRRDVRRYERSMSDYEIKNLFRDKKAAIHDLEFMAILFATDD